MINKFQESFNNIFKKYNSVITVEKGDFILETDLVNLQKVFFSLEITKVVYLKLLLIFLL